MPVSVALGFWPKWLHNILPQEPQTSARHSAICRSCCLPGRMVWISHVTICRQNQYTVLYWSLSQLIVAWLRLEREKGGWGKSRGRQTVTSQVQEFTSEREASRLNTVFSLRQYPAHDKPLLVPSLSLLQDFLVLDFLAVTSGLPYPWLSCP